MAVPRPGVRKTIPPCSCSQCCYRRRRGGPPFGEFDGDQIASTGARNAFGYNDEFSPDRLAAELKVDDVFVTHWLDDDLLLVCPTSQHARSDARLEIVGTVGEPVSHSRYAVKRPNRLVKLSPDDRTQRGTVPSRRFTGSSTPSQTEYAAASRSVRMVVMDLQIPERFTRLPIEREQSIFKSGDGAVVPIKL